MKHLFILGVALAAVSCQSNDKAAMTTATDAGAEAAVRQRVEQLAAAYSHKDSQAFLALTNPDDVIVYGTDSAEVNVGRAATEQQMKDDFATADSMRFGPLSNYHGQMSPTLATAFFDAPLLVYAGGRGYHGLVRFATVWHKRDDNQWYLAQTLVSRPTKGQSSHEMVLKQQGRATVPGGKKAAQ
ncbi:MAG: hypothetical protein NVS3B25_12490 [Hymenobacter sp.]